MKSFAIAALLGSASAVALATPAVAQEAASGAPCDKATLARLRRMVARL